MDELIPITTSPGGKSVVSARELWAFLEIKTNFSTWLARRIEEYDFKEGKDFIPKMEESRGGRPENGFVLTLNMAKELAMVERNEKGRQIRQYFIWAETKLRQLVINPPVFRLPVTYKEALQQLITKEEQREAIEQQLALAQPKVAFFDAVSVASNCIPMAAAAGVLKLPGIGRNLLFRMLRADGILKRNNEPMQQFITQGYFQLEAKTYDAGKDGEKGKRLGTITRVTPRGLQYLSRKYQSQP